MKINFDRKLLIKAIIYRIFASVFIFSISFLLTRKMSISFFIAIVEFISKIMLYYVFELIWKKIDWNKIKC